MVRSDQTKLLDLRLVLFELIQLGCKCWLWLAFVIFILLWFSCRPSFVFILELFHIASWDNPTDRWVLPCLHLHCCFTFPPPSNVHLLWYHADLFLFFCVVINHSVVAWAALPMCNEHLSISAGEKCLEPFIFIKSACLHFVSVPLSYESAFVFNSISLNYDLLLTVIWSR